MTWFGSEPIDSNNRELEEMTSLGNSDMVNIPRDSSAMNIVNDPSIVSEFGLQGAPIPPPKSAFRRAMPKMDNRIGDINWKTGETWGILIGGMALGMMTLWAWNNVTK